MRVRNREEGWQGRRDRRWRKKKKKGKKKRGSSVSIAISRIADLRNNNDPSVGGGRGVGSRAMTGRERRDEGRRGSRAPGATRREAPWGPRVQERLLPTLNAVLMPGTTGLPPQLQRRTCSRNHFSSFLLRSPSNSPSSSSWSPNLAHLSALAAEYSRYFPSFAHSSSLSPALSSYFLPSRDLSRSSSFPSLLRAVSHFSAILSLIFPVPYTCEFPHVDTYSPYCRSCGRCARCSSRARFISLSKSSPSAREAFQHPRRANPALLRHGGISHGFGLRTAVDLIAKTRRDTRDLEIRYLTFVASREKSATASAISVIANKNRSRLDTD